MCGKHEETDGSESAPCPKSKGVKPLVTWLAAGAKVVRIEDYGEFYEQRDFHETYGTMGKRACFSRANETEY